MKIIIITVALFVTAWSANVDRLTGRWQTPVSPAGNVTSVYFKEDGSFEGYVNRKPFTTGKYTLKDSIFSFTDNGCDGKQGIYKIIFFSQGDSLKLEAIADSCEERKKGMIRLVLGRIKK